MKQSEMFNLLATKLCTVTFTKVNGDERVMKCTRMIDRIPEEMRPKGTEVPNDEVIRAFDIDAQGWRSFKVECVTKFECA